MISYLSLTPPQLEMLCEAYHQVLTAADAFEMMVKRLPELTKKIIKSDVHKLHFLRTFLIVLESQAWGQPDQFNQMTKVQGIPKRTVQRDLKRLEELQITKTVQTQAKGKWATPNSRKSNREHEYGRPPAMHFINPSLSQDFIWNETLGAETRQLLSTVQKVLTTMPGLRSALERILNAQMKMVPYLPAFAEAAKRIPEIEALMARYGFKSPPPEMKLYGNLILAEFLREAMLGMRIPISDEELPHEEKRRLGALLGF